MRVPRFIALALRRSAGVLLRLANRVDGEDYKVVRFREVEVAHPVCLEDD